MPRNIITIVVAIVAAMLPGLTGRHVAIPPTNFLAVVPSGRCALVVIVIPIPISVAVMIAVAIMVAVGMLLVLVIAVVIPVMMPVLAAISMAVPEGASGSRSNRQTCRQCKCDS
jgi:hypothetical protein